LFINLTPCVPLSTLGEGEEKKEGRSPSFENFPFPLSRGRGYRG